jgi:N-acetyl-1-D-myo-inositol-2-amino-2-deoxy-alpha-D-glucopyranoside deacetylase
MTGGLLVFTAHPDDEVLIAGGTLAACSQAGVDTGVVCLTRGELGPISDRRLATRKTLGEVRVAELRAACKELGVSFVKCYRRGDGNLSASAGGEIVRQLQRIIEHKRPQSVITFGEDGIYWHPDHVATYEFVRRAVRRLASPPELCRSVWPEPMMVELIGELRRRRKTTGLWDIPPEDFGTDDLRGCFALDVRQYVPCKLRALRAHRTQISDGHALAALDFDLAERFLGVERFAPVIGDGGWLRGRFQGD